MADDQADHSDISDSDQDYIKSSVMLQYNTRKE